MKSLIIVQTICKVFKILTLIIFILMIVGAAGALSSGIILWTVAPLVDMEILNVLVSDIGDGNFVQLGFEAIASAIFLTGQTVAMGFVYSYLKHELQDGTPFTHGGARRLLDAGIIYLTVPLVAFGVSTMIMVCAGIKTEYSNEVSMMSLIGVAMVLVSFVFHYGADVLEKQQENGNSNEE